ncbi:hypothetical protein PS2_007746 [Malus domestica]
MVYGIVFCSGLCMWFCLQSWSPWFCFHLFFYGFRKKGGTVFMVPMVLFSPFFLMVLLVPHVPPGFYVVFTFLLDFVGMPELFSLKINHGGKWFENTCMRGFEAWCDYVNKDFMSFLEIDEMVKELGYDGFMLYHYRIPGMSY